MLNRDFNEFAELFNAKGVEVGGYALAGRASDQQPFAGRLKDLADVESTTPLAL